MHCSPLYYENIFKKGTKGNICPFADINMNQDRMKSEAEEGYHGF